MSFLNKQVTIWLRLMYFIPFEKATEEASESLQGALLSRMAMNLIGLEDKHKLLQASIRSVIDTSILKDSLENVL